MMKEKHLHQDVWPGWYATLLATLFT